MTMAQRSTNRNRSKASSRNGRSASQKPERYRFAHNVGGEGTVPEREYLAYAQNGAGLDDADLILNVPELKVDSIHLQVEDLEAHVAVQAQVLDLLKLNVGIDLRLGKVRVDVKGVEAQALLKARLDYVAASIDRVLTSPSVTSSPKKTIPRSPRSAARSWIAVPLFTATAGRSSTIMRPGAAPPASVTSRASPASGRAAPKASSTRASTAPTRRYSRTD